MGALCTAPPKPVTEDTSPIVFCASHGNDNECLNQYFDLLQKTLKDNDIFDKATSIFNCDESGLPLNPKSQKVVVEAGSKNPHHLTSSTKNQITVLACSSAAGHTCNTISHDSHVTYVAVTEEALSYLHGSSIPVAVLLHSHMTVMWHGDLRVAVTEEASLLSLKRLHSCHVLEAQHLYWLLNSHMTVMWHGDLRVGVTKQACGGSTPVLLYSQMTVMWHNLHVRSSDFTPITYWRLNTCITIQSHDSHVTWHMVTYVRVAVTEEACFMHSEAESCDIMMYVQQWLKRLNSCHWTMEASHL